MDNKKKTVLMAALIIALIGGALFMSGFFTQTGALLGQTQNERVTVALPVQPRSMWLGFYTAANQGYYAEEGLNVSFVYSQEGGFGVIKQVASGNALFGHAGGDSLLIARSKGIPVKSIYQNTHQNPWNIIAKKEISSLKDLEGKTISIQGPNNPLQLTAKTMLLNAGVNPNNTTWVPVGGPGMIPTFMAGKADAITGHDLYKLILEKQKAKFNVWYATDYGVNTVSMTVLTSEDTLKNNPELVEKFLRATKKGEAYAIEHPEEAANAYISKFNPSGDKELETNFWKLWVDKAIQPNKYPLGQFNKSQWEMTHDTLYEQGVMDKKVDVGSAYTEEFLRKI